MSYSVAIYVRLSDEDRDKQYKTDESESIQNQKSMLKEYCKERNWDIYDIYNDEDYSGTDRNRPEFQRMLQDCEKGFVNLVLCKSQSRFSRDSAIVETYLHDKFLEWGVCFRSVVDNVNTGDKSNKKTSQILALTNEWYVEEASESIRATLKHKREQGQFTGSFAPYGYMVDPDNKNHLLIDEAVADNVRMIFDLYTQGHGYRKIVLTLNEQGIPSPARYKEMCNSKFCSRYANDSYCKGLWTQTTIYTILRNETYTGTLVQGKTHYVSYKNRKKVKVPPEDWIRVYNTHEPIITLDVWEKAQERINSRQRALKTTQALSTLGGMVKCAYCGKPMIRQVYYNKKRTIQYYNLQCGTYKIGAMNCPNVNCISGKVLEAYLVEQINRHIKNYCDVDNITIYDTHREQVQQLTKTLNSLQKQQEQINNKLVNLYEDKLNGIINTEQYKLYASRFTDELSCINKKIDNAQEQINNLKNIKANEEMKRKLVQQYQGIDKLTREVAETFINTVEIGELTANGERDIIINWKI